MKKFCIAIMLIIFAAALMSCMSMHYQIKDPPPGKKYDIIDTVTLEWDEWYILFIQKDSYKLIDTAYQKLVEYARKLHGWDVDVINVTIRDRSWSALSLLLYFDAFGWVEHIKASGSIVKVVDK